jgi:hypothetical protein
MKEAFEEHGKIQRGEVEDPKGVDRALQESEKRQIVVFDGCLFEDNAQDEFSSFTEFGIITIRTDVNDLFIRDTVFRFNLFGNEEVAGVSTRDLTRFACKHVSFSNLPFSSQRDGYAISNFSRGSTVTIEDSCFVNNDFIGFGAIHAWSDSEITLSGNAVEGIDDDLTCQFVAASEVDNPLEDSEVTCIDAQLGSCPLLEPKSPGVAPTNPSVVPPTQSPTAPGATAPGATLAPSKSPTSTPSAAPTKRLGAALVLMVSTISLFGLF